jgi:sugar O-acyltransferase (sialic acid O-acetyltransferase NeuD family)
MIEPIYIIGASGLAKEIACYIMDCTTFYVVAFIDKEIVENNPMIVVRENKYPVINEETFLLDVKKQEQKQNAVIAIGYPKIRQMIVEKYLTFCNFPNIIHPTSYCLSNPNLGIGNVIAPHCVISVDICIGDFNIINYGVTLGHDISIGNCNVVNPQSAISGNVFIGNQNLIGAGSSILERQSIGNNNVIGMGSVVIREVKNNETCVGVPVRKIVKNG